MIFPTENPTFSLLLVSAFIKDGIAMFLERKKRTPTAIYITFVCMTAIVWYLGFWEDVFIFTVLFFWWLMLCFILLSRYGSRRLLVIQGKHQLAIHTNEPFRILHRKLIGLIFLISLPFSSLTFPGFYRSLFENSSSQRIRTAKISNRRKQSYELKRRCLPVLRVRGYILQ